LNPAKSFFGVMEGKILGHVIFKYGVKIDPERVEAIKKVPFPISKKYLQSFLGQTNFFHKFIPNYVEIVKPIYKFLKKDVKYERNYQRKKSFKEIKTAISEAHVLTSSVYSKDFQFFFLFL